MFSSAVGLFVFLLLLSLCHVHLLVLCMKVGKLKLLRSFMDISSGNVPVTVCKLAMLSLMEVFKDVLPEYRIRVFTNTEKHQKVC